jgi:hypothetical protein
MALSKKEKQRMGDAMLVAGTVRAGKEMYDVVKPIVKKGVTKVKKFVKKRKAKKLAKKAVQTREYHNNKYEEGK